MKAVKKISNFVHFGLAPVQYLPISITSTEEIRNRLAIGDHHKAWRWFFMKFKNSEVLPEHLRDPQGLPRNRSERLLWIKRKVQEGYYEDNSNLEAVAEAFIDPSTNRRAQ